MKTHQKFNTRIFQPTNHNACLITSTYSQTLDHNQPIKQNLITNYLLTKTSKLHQNIIIIMKNFLRPKHKICLAVHADTTKMNVKYDIPRGKQQENLDSRVL